MLFVSPLNFKEFISKLIMLQKKCRELRFQELHFGQFTDNRMDHLDVINICKEIMLIKVFKSCVKVY